MTGFIICAIIAGIATLYVTAPIREQHPKSVYFLTLFIPACSLGLLLMVSRDLPMPFAYTATKKEDPYIKQAQNINDQLAVRPNDPNLILELAGLQISTERFDAAITLLNDAMSKDPMNRDFALNLATAHMAKGLLFAEQGQHERAVKSLLYASAVAPEDAPFLPDIEVFIEKIEGMQAEKEKSLEEEEDEDEEGSIPPDAPSTPE